MLNEGVLEERETSVEVRVSGREDGSMGWACWACVCLVPAAWIRVTIFCEIPTFSEHSRLRLGERGRDGEGIGHYSFLSDLVHIAFYER